MFFSHLSLCIPYCQSMLGKWDWQVCVFLLMYLPFAYINLILYGVQTEAFKCDRYQCWDQLIWGRGTARVFLLILLKPLGLLIRNNSALMFGPLACEVYLWAVWEDTHAYLCTHIHIFSKRTFPLAFTLQQPHTHTHTHSHRHKRGAQRCWSIHNRLTTEIGPIIYLC